MIESLDNKKVKEWMKLYDKKHRDLLELFLIEGDQILNEAIKHSVIKEIITTDLSYESKYPTFYISEKVMNKLSRQVTPPKIIAVCKKKKELALRNKILVLDRIQDPGNLGTMIRSAVAFNFDTIVLSNDTVDLYNDKVIRSTEGMLFHLNVLKRDLEKFIPELSDYQIFRTDVENGNHVKDIHFENKLAIVIGNEGKGIRSSLKKIISEAIYIPMNSKCESLNAAISASIIMYEVNHDLNR